MTRQNINLQKNRFLRQLFPTISELLLETQIILLSQTVVI